MADNSMILMKGYGREVDQLALAYSRLGNWARSTTAGGILIAAKSLVKFSMATQLAARDADKQEEALEGLTKTQKFLHKRILKGTFLNKKFAAGFEFLNRNTDEGNKQFMRMAMGLTGIIGTIVTVVTVFGLLVIALGVLSAAFQGADSPIVEMTENMGFLHNIATGLAEAFDPEADGTAWDVIAASMAVFAGVALLLSVPIGVLVGAGVLAAGVFNHLKDTVVGVIGAASGAGAVMGAAIGGLIAFSATASSVVGQVVLAINVITGQASIFATAAQVGTGTIMAGFALIIGGLAGLLAFASGSMGGVKAVIMGVLSAIMVGLGLFLLGVAAIPAAIIAAVLFVVAAIYRYRKEIYDGFVWLYDGIVGIFSDIADTVSGLMPDINIPTLGSLKGMFKADGGPVTGGRSYIVGEKGPEMFTPSASGSITPNHQMSGGGGGQTINMSINVSGVTDRSDKRDLAREIGNMINEEIRRQGGGTTRGRF